MTSKPSTKQMMILQSENLKDKLIVFLAVIFCIVTTFGCTNENNQDYGKANEVNSRVEKLKLLPDFHADHLYSPSENEQGSWVAMAFDDKGRMIACDQYGYLYRVTIPPVGSDTSRSKINVEKLEIKMEGDTASMKLGYAHGLLYAHHSLYVMVNDEGDTTLSRRSGLYRLQDTDDDDQYDKITLLKRLNGDGEHGPHTAVLAPDGQSIYVIAGNFTEIPEMNGYRYNGDTARLDNLFPLIRDPNGHDNVVNTHGGWIARTDSSGSKWELIASGFRNPFDMAFNEDGKLFTYDSDMEWDIGLPWYRPTRICHVTSGSEFGWRQGTNKWSPAYPDNSPPILNIGQGSPTSFFSGQHARFPQEYRHSLFAFDWSFGIVYAIHLTPEGSSYKAKAKEFISGAPLPLTDGMIGPDGALYFLTGGRKLESNLYRVYYRDNKASNAALASGPSGEAMEARRIRHELEKYHYTNDPKGVEFAWPYLKHNDRFIRYAARVAIEKQPVSQWKEKALAEKDPLILTQVMIALARFGEKGLKEKILNSLVSVDFRQFTPTQQIDFLRAVELTLYRMGRPGITQNAELISYLGPNYPASNNELNRLFSKILVYIGDPQATTKTLALMDAAKDDDSLQQSVTNSSDLILRNPQYGMDIAKMLSNTPPAQQIYYATVLGAAKEGWTPEASNKYFKWFNTAFGFKAGNSYIGFIDRARKMALQQVAKNQYAHYDALSGSALLDSKNGNRLASTVERPKGPGRNWMVDSALAALESTATTPNFEQGKAMFVATQCQSCHRLGGEGSDIGPDLTQLGTRFSTRDILVSIIEPSKEISDQFAATYFYMKDGSSVVGRVKNQDNAKYYISQNPFAPQQVREILKTEVARTSISDAPSIMYPGLINNLNPEELKNLMAYLKSGGNKAHEVYKQKAVATR
jgi:putative heme-binding domain-containing protein